MRTTRILPLVLICALVGAPLLSATAAIADSVTDLGWSSSFGAMLVDGARSQLILSGGGGGSEIKFADLDGSITGTLTGFSGPTGLAINGSTLYVLETGSGDLTPVDLTNDTVGSAITTSLTNRSTLTFANGRLWTSNAAGLDRINPTTGVVTSFTTADFVVGGEPSLTTNPVDTGQIAMLSVGGGVSDLRIFDVSTAPPTLVRSTTVSSAGGDVRYSPDGSQLFTPGDGGPNEYATSDLSLTHSYAFGGSGSPGLGLDTVEVSGVPYLGGGGQSSGHIRVFADGAANPTTDVAYPGPGMQSSSPPVGGVRFSPTGDRLFVVAYVGGGNYTLTVVADPTHPGSQVTLAAPLDVVFGTAAHLTGSLTYNDAAPVAAGETVQIWQRVEDQTAAMVGTTTTETGGAWSFDQPTDETELNKILSFWAVFPGNATHRTATSATDTTQVTRIRPTLTLQTSTGAITVGNKVRVDVHLELDATINRTVKILAKYAGSGTAQQVAQFRVDAKGKGSATVAPIHNVTYSAVSMSDKHHDAARSNQKTVKVRAKVTGTLLGNYGSSGGVRLYHSGVNPGFAVHVDPNSTGSNTWVTLQRRASGGWKTVARLPFELRRGSRVLLVINGKKLARGVVYRIQATFENSRNALGASRWMSFKVT